MSYDKQTLKDIIKQKFVLKKYNIDYEKNIDGCIINLLIFLAEKFEFIINSKFFYDQQKVYVIYNKISDKLIEITISPVDYNNLKNKKFFTLEFYYTNYNNNFYIDLETNNKENFIKLIEEIIKC